MVQDNIQGASMVRVMAPGTKPVEIAFQRGENVQYYIHAAERQSSDQIRYDEKQHEITLMGKKVKMTDPVEEYGVTLTIAPNFVNGEA